MSRADDRRAAADKAACAARIRATYPDLIRRYREDLCGHCRLYRAHGCGLIPFTSDGQPCPYFEREL